MVFRMVAAVFQEKNGAQGYKLFMKGCSYNYWKQYMQAYEACLTATSTTIAPWYGVPADDKKNARLIISRIILDTFKTLKMHYPKTDTKRRQELLSIREQLMKQAPADN